MHELGSGLFLFAQAAAVAEQEAPQQARPMTALAIAIWAGLVILLALLVGLALISWASRRARRLLRRRAQAPTDMRDIWFLNPPERRKRDEP